MFTFTDFPAPCLVDVDDQPNQRNNPNYTRESQAVLEGLDEGGGVKESGHVSKKKRRLSVDQVKALEQNFEVENKLEPERKLKLAQELGLQARQVAVWFQNRRARWKTKQLERDYGGLKADHDALKHNCEALQRDNESLRNEIQELKAKLNEDGNTDNKASVKEPLMSHNQGKSKRETRDYCLAKGDKSATDLNFNNCDGEQLSEVLLGRGASASGDFKDGSSDSDSSAILNGDNNSSSPIAAISTKAGILHHSPHQFLDIRGGSSSSSSMNTSFQLSEYDGSENVLGDSHEAYQPQFAKTEEHNFFGEESCSTLFSDDEAPTLHWYCSQECRPEGLNSQIFL